MIPQLIVGACITAGAVFRRRRLNRLNRRPPSTRTATVETIDDPAQTSYQRDLQQLFEIAYSNPRLLLSNRVRNKIQRVTRRINQAQDPVPWQLAFIYRQMDSAVDSLSYEELYDLFGGNPTPPAISRDEAKSLQTRVYRSSGKKSGDIQGDEETRSDEVTCPICLECYENGDRLMTLPNCQHVYHAKCIVQWLRLRGDCPICRSSIKDEMKSSNCTKHHILTQ